MSRRLQVILEDEEMREIRNLAAVRHRYPTAEIEQMLSEIQSGYLQG